jgi:hypothetical protein
MDAEDFVTHLPLFRRVFSVLDKAERRRLMDAVFGRARSGQAGYRLVSGAEAFWPQHFDRIASLLDAGAPR